MLENVSLSPANQAFIVNRINNAQAQTNTDEDNQVKEGESKLKYAITGLGILGIAVAAGVLISKGKAKKIPDEGIKKLLEENPNLTGKFKKTLKNGDKVIVEYVDGVLQKSTRKGEVNFEKTYSIVNDEKIVKITQDGTTTEKNLTQIVNKAKKHQEDYTALINKQDINLDELQSFDRENLSKKQIEELDEIIKTKKDALELKKKAEKQANQKPKTQGQPIRTSEAKVEKQSSTVKIQKNPGKKKPVQNSNKVNQIKEETKNVIKEAREHLEPAVEAVQLFAGQQLDRLGEKIGEGIRLISSKVK